MKRLTLKSETLAELTDEQLNAVVGGALPTTPVKECTQDPFYTWRPTQCLCP